MTDTVYKENAHDFEVRFLECYGVKDNLVFFSSNFMNVNDDEVSMKYYGLEIHSPRTIGKYKYDRYLLRDNYEPEVIQFDNNLFPIPKLGFINHAFFTIFFERRHKKGSPSRYRRGFRRDTVDITNPSLYELDCLFGNNNEFRMDQDTLFQNVAYDLFFPSFFSYEEALDKVRSGDRLAAAISPTIAIKYDSRNNSICLMKNLWKVGDFNEEANAFSMRTPIFNNDFEEIGAKIA